MNGKSGQANQPDAWKSSLRGLEVTSPREQNHTEELATAARVEKKKKTLRRESGCWGSYLKPTVSNLAFELDSDF